MTYLDQKKKIIQFFENYILEYLIPDLEKLNSIIPDSNGRGGCTIPQAIATFAAVDLMGYFMDPNPNPPSISKMKLKVFLSNADFFPELQNLNSIDDFLDSFRDDVRSIMTHRFFLTRYDIAKLQERSLFVQQGSKRIFNASYFTELVISAIKLLYKKISDDSFILAGDKNKEETMQRLNDRLNALKNYQSDTYVSTHTDTFISTSLTTQTTKSLD